jgi:GH25 family lysozyme M1 (1,4-beta-N-acetylmuramidase)
MECSPIEQGNVVLVEPNCININTENVINGIPQYQDMYIFAELTARSKGRTIITNGNVNTTTSKTINFIGNNQNNENPNNPNYLNFTTNYYDGSNPDGKYYEGFGMNSIKIVINSSFIPQVDIQFVDIRGLAFFNQVDSPYRILFDFPPPIFTLTVKGYYGKPLTYQLHLVKYTSEFSAENGNFIIDAQFVAMTFAPLADILFRYVVNAPLINNEKSMNSKPGTEITNTFGLIKKLKNLYADIAKMLDTDVEYQNWQNISNDLEKIDLTFEILKNYENNETLKPAGTPYLVMRTPDPNDGLSIFPVTNSIPQDKLTVINKLSEYDEVIKSDNSSGIKSRIKNRLYLVYIVATNIKEENNTEPPPLFEIKTYDFEYNTENNSQFEEPLLKYKDQLLSENITSIVLNDKDKDITNPKSFLNAYNIQSGTRNPTGYTKYYGIDISGFYNKLYKKKSELETKEAQLSTDITEKINAMIEGRLGMTLSIYNVFKIILDDVDEFFDKIKSTAVDAFESHNNVPENKKIILDNPSYKDNDITVYPFPLIIQTLDNREERVAPIELSKKVRFPEIELVHNFMDTFMMQNRYEKQLNSRENQGDDGTYKWIPISPLDSKLGDANPESPYLGISDDVKTETLNIILKRFYMLTQGTIPEAFYPDENGERKTVKENYIRSGAYLNLYSKAEAINLESTLTTKKNADTLKIMADVYSRNIDKFYEDISGITTTYNTDSGEVTGSLYDFPQYAPEYFLISPLNENVGRVYTDKTNPNFEGIKITNENIVIQSSGGKDPLDNFKDEINISGFWGRDKKYKSIAENYFDFTEQNLLYLRDKTFVIGTNTVEFGESITTYSRYLSGAQYYYENYTMSGARHGTVKDIYNTYPGWENSDLTDAQRQNIAYSQGNAAFKEKVSSEGKQLDFGADIIDIWSEQLGQYDEYIIDEITGTTQLSSVIVLSNFGFSISPFNKYPNLLNSLIFDTPSAIEVPSYYAPYIGALITAEEQGWMNDVVDFFTTGNGSYLDNRGFFVLADAHDVNEYLSEKDKEKFKTAYETYMRTIHGNINSETGIVTGIKNMYDWVRSNGSSELYPDILGWKRILYRYFLNPNGNDIKEVTYGKRGMFFNVISDLISRETIVNYSQITFQMSDLIPPYAAGYTSIKTLNETGKKDIIQNNANYFKNLFTELSSLIIETNKKLKIEEEEAKKMKGDKNIINQLYYSFKNINDKWLTGTAAKKYPFNKPNKGLIDSFIFVDRGMNPIGETIINCEILCDMLDDPNISLFSVLTQLLSLNGFEFFPLQNFLNFETPSGWEDSFKIHTAGYDNTQNSFFVCMYLGGDASYPSVSGNGFVTDGIINIAAPGIKGFSGDDSGSQFEENQKQNQEFSWRQVRAFRVRFGEQNQSMFTDIKIDSKEYPETNESIRILARLAGDGNPNAPVPIGQSLYNLYENRSYKATVTGLGNAMIQPTQYFQLENIPLFNGAYIILTVEHNITPNKMTTSFSGTKLLKYPIPRILTSLANTNYNNATSGEIAKRAQQAKMMTPERVENNKNEGGLESKLGVDVSHWNGIIDWKKAKTSGVKFAIMKLTQGETWYDGDHYNINKNINDALANDIILTYYHFAEFGRTSSPTVDGQNDANWFIAHLNQLPEKPKLPIVLDLEEMCFNNDKPYMWGQISKPNAAINEYVKAFIDTVEASGYNIMIYCRTDLIKLWNLYNYSKYPFWVARYMRLDGKYNPERDEPTIPKEWKNSWTAWQFTSTGMVDGVSGNIDLNVMKKEFIDDYTT